MTRAPLDGSALASIERVIAIVGCQRSGTTLTGQILGAHPRAVLIDEFDGLYPWFASRASHARDAAGLAHAMVESAAHKYRTRTGRFAAGPQGTGVCGEISTLILKAPNLTYDEARLARLGVPVTILYPVRDPRAVVASMRRLAHVPFVENQLRLIAERPSIEANDAATVRTMRDEHQPLHVRQAAMWALKSGRADALAATGLSVHSFHYESLVCDTASQIDRLLHVCKLETVPEVRAPERAYVGLGPGDTDRTRAIDTTSLATWRDRLSDHEQNDILRTAGALARRFGYGA